MINTPHPDESNRDVINSNRLQSAVKQIEFAREYTKSLLADVGDEEWFIQPGEGVTHIGWQVGHLAMAQYGLTMFRMRGRQPIDTELMSSSFRKRFQKGTIPDPDPANNPSPDEILATLDRVHVQALAELPQYTDQQLDEPVEMPYSAYATKLGGLLFCSAHEMLHAGQVGLIRRLLGKEPIR